MPRSLLFFMLGAPMRILHFSDVHLPIPYGEISWRDWLNKRAIGGLNSWLRRSHHFAEAALKVERLGELVRREKIELVLSTGDHTQLGTEAEYRQARVALEPLMSAPLGLMHVPGNHDLYLPDTVSSKRFERFFSETLVSDALATEVEKDGAWPVVRLVNSEVAVIAVGSARPNSAPWRSSGRVPEQQLRAIQRLIHTPEIQSRFTFVITHYAPHLEGGKPDSPAHGLTNAREFLEACTALRRGVILHGHVHRSYRVSVPALRVPTFGAGSATFAGREGLWLFEVADTLASVRRGFWDGMSYQIDPDGMRIDPSSDGRYLASSPG